ncbi:hypothetical protein [Chondromyces apiculatus]|uniref:Uncharacterized protein n=1 Tax=Chondromyces apiculatus DSM 436 TaxID=1192034 RepID=A0A017T268_9BACT|nr:hypothetical protein [Chondromyces apiculatus]EYF02636.1 Hypothetical protein CAP_6666 [Chondromyces apiculatus DSM 436]
MGDTAEAGRLEDCGGEDDLRLLRGRDREVRRPEERRLFEDRALLRLTPGNAGALSPVSTRGAPSGC